jgi:hypothetical protein
MAENEDFVGSKMSPFNESLSNGENTKNVSTNKDEMNNESPNLMRFVHSNYVLHPC